MEFLGSRLLHVIVALKNCWRVASPRSVTQENAEIFYFPDMMKFANFEFMFAIRGPKLARRSVQGKLIKHKIGGFLFTCTTRMTWSGQARGPIQPQPLQGEGFG